MREQREILEDQADRTLFRRQEHRRAGDLAVVEQHAAGAFAVSMPAAMLSSVVLPEPEGPSRQSTSPGSAASLTSVSVSAIGSKAWPMCSKASLAAKVTPAVTLRSAPARPASDQPDKASEALSLGLPGQSSATRGVNRPSSSRSMSVSGSSSSVEHVGIGRRHAAWRNWTACAPQAGRRPSAPPCRAGRGSPPARNGRGICRWCRR